VRGWQGGVFVPAGSWKKNVLPQLRQKFEGERGQKSSSKENVTEWRKKERKKGRFTVNWGGTTFLKKGLGKEEGEKRDGAGTISAMTRRGEGVGGFYVERRNVKREW